ncbi:hypothetical protein H261_18662 [Paramagnetospirillum caucaseum]|uniref:Uncharacterized protein n=1 Tax=Paramagnetospirillum caucaseum TaxID=1244869 RepID=M2Z275_9PROT|nr:hypothetical protein [Paramagnetospirillum caucaseum]EME68410.1 hypothetical protein H261_18662 [Paramagnetospirillum caucaseum]
MSKSNAFSVGGLSLPLDIDAVLEEAEAPPLTLGSNPVAFDFGFRFVRFAARLEQVGGGVQLKLVGDMGPMPFSAESPAARSGLARIVDAGNAVLGAGTFRINQGRILLGGEAGVPTPVAAVGLVSAVTRFLAPAIPYMELISMYVRPPLAPARPGESAVQPQWRKTKARGR